jgi:hypothetical protein
MTADSGQSVRGELERQQAYWQRQLGGELPVLHLCPDYPRPPLQSFIRASEAIELGREICGKVRTFCARVQVTPFVLLLATFTAFFS